MRRVTTLFIALMSTVAIQAQTTTFSEQQQNDHLAEPESYKVYCTLSALHNGATFASISRVEIDYGQEQMNKNYLVDDYGKPLSYRTVTAAANHLSKLGWEHEDSYVVGEDNIRCVWIMSKEVTDDRQITEGFKTRWMYENYGPHPIK